MDDDDHHRRGGRGGGGGFAAVELNDSFDEKGGRRRRDFEEGDEKDEEMSSSSPHHRPTASSTTKMSASFATPPTTTTTGKSGETMSTRRTRTEEEEHQNHLSRSSAESSPSPTSRAAESRDTISELPRTPTRHLPGGSPSQYRNHEHNRSISATSMDGLISRLDEESGSGVGETTTNVRFDEFTDAFVRRRRESNVVVRAASKALDIPWCFGESRKTRKNVLMAAIVLVLILFAAIPLRHWQHMS